MPSLLMLCLGLEGLNLEISVTQLVEGYVPRAPNAVAPKHEHWKCCEAGNNSFLLL